MLLAIKLIFLSVCGALVQATVYPVRGGSTEGLYTERGDTVRIYPDVVGPIDNLNYSYFGSRLDFSSVNGSILIGGADKLYLLDKDLSPVQDGILTWTSNGCSGNSINDPVTCRNHIRVYEKIPGEEGSLFVCGTFSTSPLCTTVQIAANGGLAGIANTTEAAPGIISPDPNLPGFGEFRKNGSSSDHVYFSASFRSTQTSEFDISYQEVGDDSATSRLYGIQFSSDKWLKNPLFFVDYLRADYTPSPSPEDYQFYFVFLRESLNNAEREIVISRVIRICRNDVGILFGGEVDQTIFDSYLKAMIFCEREIPPGNEFVGAQNYQYNEIWSVALNNGDGGRFVDDGTYSHLMYGAFSGPLIGPRGTAICVYDAGNSGSPDMSMGFNRGLFDIFRENVINTDDPGSQEQEPVNVECSTQRGLDQAQFVNVAQNMGQIGENPLVIFEGFHVTQIAVDVTCVVSRTNRSECFNQDVLFLATSSGKVMKVLFASRTVEQDSMTPVISEEIELDDENSINEMKIEVVGGVKQLYVVTDSRLYRLPLESCDRYNHGNFSSDTAHFNSCIGSRDPYCVWNSVNRTCEASQLLAWGRESVVVPPYILQNISGPINLPFIEFQSSSVQVSEGVGIVEIIVTSTHPVPSDGVVLVRAFNGTALYDDHYSLPSQPLPLTFNTDTLQAIVPILIIDNVYYDPSRLLSFRLELMSPLEHNEVFLGMTDVTVTIVDNEDVPLVNISSPQTVRSVSEDVVNMSFPVTVTTTVEMVPGLVELTVEDGSATAGIDYMAPDPVTVVFNGLTGTATLLVQIIRRSGYQGNRNFSLVLRNTELGAVLFGEQRELVWILDDEGSPFRLVIGNLDQDCSQWILVDYDNKLAAVNSTVEKVLSPRNQNENISLGRLFCDDSIVDKRCVQYEAVVRTKQGEVASAITAIETWTQGTPNLDGSTGYSQLKVQSIGTCPVMIFASNNPPCVIVNKITDPGGLGTSSANSGPAVTGLSVVFVLAVCLLIAASIVIVIMVVLFVRQRKSVKDDVELKKHDMNPVDTPENSLTRLSVSFNRTGGTLNPDSTNGAVEVDHNAHTDVGSDV